MITQEFYLANTAYHEARGEPADGIVAVCHVILNRVLNRGLTVKQVVYQSKQFECYSQRKQPIIKDYDSFIKCQYAVKRTRDERLKGFNFYGATIFMNVPVVIERYGHLPGWLTRGLDSGKVQRVAIIKDHTFYKESPR